MIFLGHGSQVTTKRSGRLGVKRRKLEPGRAATPAEQVSGYRMEIILKD